MMETIVLPAQDHLAHERCRAMPGLMYKVDRVPRSARRRGSAPASAIETTTSHFMLRTRTGGDIPLNVVDVQKAVHKHSERVEKWTSTDRKRPSDRKKTNHGGGAAVVGSGAHPSTAIPRTRSGEELPLNGQKNIRKKPPRDLEEIGQTPAQHPHPPFVSADGQGRGAETARVATSGTGSHSHHHKKVIKKKISNEHSGNSLIRTRSPDSTDSDEGKSGKEKDGHTATLSQCATVLAAGLSSPPSELGLAFTPPKATGIDATATTLYGQIDSSITTFQGLRGGAIGAPGRGRLLGRTGSLITEGERHASEKGRPLVSRSDSAGAVEFFGSTPPKGSERWAGPGFTNSPPPSTLPLPKFPFRLKAGVTAADRSMENSTGSDSTPTAHSMIPLLATSGMLGGSVDPSSATKQLRKLLNLGEELKNAHAEEGKPEFKSPALVKMLKEELQSISKKEGSEDLKSIATAVYDDVKALIEVEEVCNKMNSAATWQLKKMLQL